MIGKVLGNMSSGFNTASYTVKPTSNQVSGEKPYDHIIRNPFYMFDDQYTDSNTVESVSEQTKDNMREMMRQLSDKDFNDCINDPRFAELFPQAAEFANSTVYQSMCKTYDYTSRYGTPNAAESSRNALREAVFGNIDKDIDVYSTAYSAEKSVNVAQSTEVPTVIAHTTVPAVMTTTMTTEMTVTTPVAVPTMTWPAEMFTTEPLTIGPPMPPPNQNVLTDEMRRLNPSIQLAIVASSSLDTLSIIGFDPEDVRTRIKEQTELYLRSSTMTQLNQFINDPIFAQVYPSAAEHVQSDTFKIYQSLSKASDLPYETQRKIKNSMCDELIGKMHEDIDHDIDNHFYKSNGMPFGPGHNPTLYDVLPQSDPYLAEYPPHPESTTVPSTLPNTTAPVWFCPISMFAPSEQSPILSSESTTVPVTLPDTTTAVLPESIIWSRPVSMPTPEQIAANPTLYDTPEYWSVPPKNLASNDIMVGERSQAGGKSNRGHEFDGLTEKTVSSDVDLNLS